MHHPDGRGAFSLQGGGRLRTDSGGSRAQDELHAYGTNIEGDWDTVFQAVKRCHEALHAAGVPRISTNMRFGTRTDKAQKMEDKVRSVEEKLRGEGPG